MNELELKIYDGHIHTHGKPGDPPEVFVEKARICGVVGGTVFSVHPAKYRPFPDWDQRAKSRIDRVLEFTSRAPGRPGAGRLMSSEPPTPKEMP